MEDLLHLGKDEGNFVLEQRRASVVVLWQESLAYGTARILRIELPKREHCSVAIEKTIALVVEKNRLQSGNICVAWISCVVERRRWIVCFEAEVFEIDTLSLAHVSRFVPIYQVLG